MSLRRTIVLLLLVGVGILLVMLGLPLAEAAVDLVSWIRGAGATGVLVFALVYMAAVVALLPGSVLTLGAGFLYGPVVGTLLVPPVSVAAATAAFVLGRTAARDWIAQRMAGVRRFDAVDRAVGHEGFTIVLLLRLSPLFPFTLLNYALGLTRVRLRDYVLASWIGMLPGTVLYVYLGSLLTSATELAAGASTNNRWRHRSSIGVDWWPPVSWSGSSRAPHVARCSGRWANPARDHQRSVRRCLRECVGTIHDSGTRSHAFRR